MPTPQPISWSRIGLAALGSFVSSALWVALIVAAIEYFGRSDGRGDNRLRDSEWIGFATAYAVSGSLALFASSATFGILRRAVLTLVFVVILLPVPAYQVLRTVDPSAMRFFSMASSAARFLEATRPGLVFGLITGAMSVLPIVALGMATRRRLSWRVAAIAVGVLFAAMAWVLPGVVAYSWTAIESLGEHLDVWHRTLTALLSAAIVGPIWGAVVGVVTSRWFHPVPKPSPSA